MVNFIQTRAGSTHSLNLTALRIDDIGRVYRDVCERHGRPRRTALQRSVLVAPQPGEPHMLCAALDSEVLWKSGWRTRCEYPKTNNELQDLLAKEWFDALDLSLSASFRREHWLPRVAKTISGARAASCNPALAVLIGGRLFTEQPELGVSVGADACIASSTDVVEAVSRVFDQRRRA